MCFWLLVQDLVSVAVWFYVWSSVLLHRSTNLDLCLSDSMARWLRLSDVLPLALFYLGLLWLSVFFCVFIWILILFFVLFCSVKNVVRILVWPYWPCDSSHFHSINSDSERHGTPFHHPVFLQFCFSQCLKVCITEVFYLRDLVRS